MRPAGFGLLKYFVRLRAEAVRLGAGVKAGTADGEIRAPGFARAQHDLQALGQLLDPIRPIREPAGVAAVGETVPKDHKSVEGERWRCKGADHRCEREESGCV